MKPTTTQASAEYTMKFRNTSTAHAEADALNRLLLPVEPTISKLSPELVLLADHFLTYLFLQIKSVNVPGRIYSCQRLFSSCSKNGRVRAHLRIYFHPFMLYEGYLLWVNRIVILTLCREAVLTELHTGHPGCTRKKGLLRQYVW